MHDRNETIQELIGNGEDVLDTKIEDWQADEAKNTMRERALKKFGVYLGAKPEINDKLEQEVKRLLYNNRKMVTATDKMRKTNAKKRRRKKKRGRSGARKNITSSSEEVKNEPMSSSKGAAEERDASDFPYPGVDPDHIDVDSNYCRHELLRDKCPHADCAGSYSSQHTERADSWPVEIILE